MITRAQLIERAWHLIVVGAGIAHAFIGATFLLSDGNLDGPVFASAAGIPAAVWGTWALSSGLLIVPARTRLAGLIVTAAWYALWGAFLIFGVVDVGRPFYAIPVYMFLILLHMVFAIVDWLERRL